MDIQQTPRPNITNIDLQKCNEPNHIYPKCRLQVSDLEQEIINFEKLSVIQKNQVLDTAYCMDKLALTASQQDVNLCKGTI